MKAQCQIKGGAGRSDKMTTHNSQCCEPGSGLTPAWYANCSHVVSEGMNLEESCLE